MKTFFFIPCVKNFWTSLFFFLWIKFVEVISITFELVPMCYDLVSKNLPLATIFLPLSRQVAT